jgi:hypothetical protein
VAGGPPGCGHLGEPDWRRAGGLILARPLAPW